jgi:Uma2 family endonuclease
MADAQPVPRLGEVHDDEHVRVNAMAQPQQKRMTADEFLVWHQSQEDKFELVDGIPVLKNAKSKATRDRLKTGSTAVAGGTLTHSSVASNIIGHLFAKLRTSSCKPYGSDLAVRTAIDQVRYPEVSIDCGSKQGGSKEATKPIAVFEVLLPSTRVLDLQIKQYEYMRHPSLRTIVVVDTDAMDVFAHACGADGKWSTSRLRASTDSIELQGTDARLSLAEIYDGVAFESDKDAASGSSV